MNTKDDSTGAAAAAIREAFDVSSDMEEPIRIVRGVLIAVDSMAEDHLMDPVATAMMTIVEFARKALDDIEARRQTTFELLHPFVFTDTARLAGAPTSREGLAA